MTRFGETSPPPEGTTLPVPAQRMVIEPRRYEDEQVQQLVAAVQAEYVVRYGGPDAAQVEPDEFAPPRGRFFVGLLDGDPVAMGGWRLLAPGEAELKRMYVVAALRRRGLSRQMLQHLEATAAEAGIERMVLNTGLEQPEAVALYESAGYTPIPGFGHYANAPLALFYGKTLTAISRG